MRSASYTRGVPPPGVAHTFDPLMRNSPMAGGVVPPQQHMMQHASPVVLQHQSSLPVAPQPLPQARRHSMSFNASPYHSHNYSEDRTNLLEGSPKKMRAYSHQRSPGFFGMLKRKMDESKYLNPKFLRNNRSEFVGWIGLMLVIMVVYKFFSDGSFSAVLTLSSAFQCFSLVLLNLKVMNQQSVAGVSQRSVFLIVVCLVFRLVSTLFYNGYLPVDKSGDWVYQGADVISVFMGVSLLMYSRAYCRTTSDAQKDKDTCPVLAPIVISFILAVLIHPTLNQNFLADTAWTFSLYLETFAMIPQLFLMAKIGGEVEALTSHYTASMAASKVFSFLFWYFSFTELAPRRGGRNIAGWAVILSYCIQSLLFLDFFYYYVKSLRIGRKMIINF